MKKFILSLILLGTFTFTIKSQVKLNDFGRIILNSYLPADMSITGEAKKLLETKLKEIASINGMGGSAINARFIITASVNTGTKDIISGAPQQIAQKLNVTLFVGDAVSNTIFSSVTISLKGVGTNENKAYIDAFNSINPKNKEVISFLEDGKNKIISYYSSQCDFTANEAKTLVDQQQFDAAIYKLGLVPQVCKECYLKSQETIQDIYQQKINYDGNLLLSKAKAAWTTEQNISGAEKARYFLNQINQFAGSYREVAPFIKQMEAKISADEKIQWQFEMKKYADDIEMEKKQRTDNLILEKNRINAWREVAAEYAKNQPDKVVYTYIVW
jgi:hypothetical protein